MVEEEGHPSGVGKNPGVNQGNPDDRPAFDHIDLGEARMRPYILVGGTQRVQLISLVGDGCEAGKCRVEENTHDLCGKRTPLHPAGGRRVTEMVMMVVMVMMAMVMLMVVMPAL